MKFYLGMDKPSNVSKACIEFCLFTRISVEHLSVKTADIQSFVIFISKTVAAPCASNPLLCDWISDVCYITIIHFNSNLRNAENAFPFFKFQAVQEHPLSLDAGGQYDVSSAK